MSATNSLLFGSLALGKLTIPGRCLKTPELVEIAKILEGDGLVNFLGYAFRTSSAAPNAGTPVSASNVTIPGEGVFPAFTYRQRMDTEALRYAVEVASDLSSSWQSNVIGQPEVTVPVGAPVNNDDGTWSVTMRHAVPITPAAPKRFFRVRVTYP